MVFNEKGLHVMRLEGQQQTCYADWSRAVLTFYPHNPKFARNGDIIEVWYDDKQVAEFNFGNGKGQIIHAKQHNLEEVGKIPNFEPFDLDSMVQLR